MAGSKSFVDPHGVAVHDQRKIEKGYISLESSLRALRAPQQHHTNTQSTPPTSRTWIIPANLN